MPRVINLFCLLTGIHSNTEKLVLRHINKRNHQSGNVAAKMMSFVFTYLKTQNLPVKKTKK